MNWHNFFNDLEKWMQASNVILQKDGLDSERYWQWLIETLEVIEVRYNRNPLVVKLLATIASFQDDQYKRLHEGDSQ